jgi:cell division protein FtsL
MFIGLFLLVVIFAALVAGIYLDVTARTATIGREIQVMEEEIEALKLVNADLESRLAF